MDPQQPYQGNNYDFIMNPGQAPKKSLIPKVGGGSFARKLMLILGGAFVLIVGMWFVGNMLGGSGVNSAAIISMTQSEQEISRVAAFGSTSGDGNIRNAAANITYTIATQQQEWLAFLAERGTKVKEDDLNLKLNETADQRLADARANNTFDVAYKEIMHSYLTDYSTTLSTNFDKSTNEAERALLTNHFGEVKLLLEQLPD